MIAMPRLKVISLFLKDWKSGLRGPVMIRGGENPNSLEP